MIKVFHIIPTLGVGGAEKLVTDIGLNINKEKFSITIITLYKNENSIFLEDLKKHNINVIELNKRKGPDLSLILKFNKLFKKDKPDVINTHLYVTPYVCIPAILQKVKIKIHTVHNIATKELPWKFRIIMKMIYHFFGFVPIAISDYIKDTIQKEYNLKSNEIECIYNGIDTNKFICNQKYIHNDNIVFINVARMSEAKKQILLIEAFKLVNDKYKNTRLHIVGDGKLRKKIEDKIRELGLEEKVILRGIRKNISKELNNASVFVLSSEYEGLPLSVLEAMASGLPIITTDAGGVIDIVKNNINGIIVQKNNIQALADAMIKICENDNCIKKMGNESYLLSKMYDIKKMAKEYENLYIRLINKRKEKDEGKRNRK